MAFWTEQKVNQLIKLWVNGHSAQEVATIIGCKSRSAVLGKLHWLKEAKNIVCQRIPRTGRRGGGAWALDITKSENFEKKENIP